MDDDQEEGISQEEKARIDNFVKNMKSRGELEYLLDTTQERLEKIDQEQEEQAFREIEELLRRKGLSKEHLRKLVGGMPPALGGGSPEEGEEVAIPPNLVKRLKELAPHGLYNPNAMKDKRWGDPEKKRWHMPRWLEQELHRLRQIRGRVRDDDLEALARRYPLP